jgi:hypothetical protein
VLAISFVVICMNSVGEANVAFVRIVERVHGTFEVVVRGVTLQQAGACVDGAPTLDAVVRRIVEIKIRWDVNAARRSRRISAKIVTRGAVVTLTVIIPRAIARKVSLPVVLIRTVLREVTVRRRA